MKKILLILLTVLLMLSAAACGKKSARDTNAVLTDSNVPLELGAQVPEEETATVAAE